MIEGAIRNVECNKSLHSALEGGTPGDIDDRASRVGRARFPAEASTSRVQANGVTCTTYDSNDTFTDPAGGADLTLDPRRA